MKINVHVQHIRMYMYMYMHARVYPNISSLTATKNPFLQQFQQITLQLILMKALKCKTFGVELVMNTRTHIALYYIIYMYAPFTLTTIYLTLTFVGNGRQSNLPRGNFND